MGYSIIGSIISKCKIVSRLYANELTKNQSLRDKAEDQGYRLDFLDLKYFQVVKNAKQGCQLCLLLLESLEEAKVPKA